MRLNITPVAVGAAAGALDGVLEDADHKAGRLTNTTQWSTYYEAALVALGFVGDHLGFGRDVTEPAFYGGLFKLASRGGAFVAKTQIGAYAAPYAMPAAGQIVPSDSRRQPPGVLA